MALALDGKTSGAINLGTSGTAALTTTSAKDVIIVAVAAVSEGQTLGAPPTVSSITDTSSLTWTKRKQFTGNNVDVEEWYAIAASALTTTITVNLSAAGTAVIEAFGISGANTTTPFDSNSTLPATATGTASPLTVNISTSNANDFIFGIGGAGEPGVAGTGILTVGSGYTSIELVVSTAGKIAGKQQNNVDEGTEYQIVSVTKTGFAVNFTESVNDNWAIIADAVVQAPAGASTTGAGTEASSTAFKLSQAVSGAGLEHAAATTLLSQKTSGAGTEHGATSLLASSKTSGAGTERGVATVTASSKISGAGTESSTTAFVRSQAVSGAGTEKATATAVSGAKSVSASGTEHGAATFVASSKASGAGTEHGAAGLVASSKISGAGAEHGAASLLASQKVSGAGAEKAAVAFSLSQKASGVGAEHGAASLTASSTASGVGTEHGLASVVSGQKSSGSGIEHGAASLVASSKASGAGTHRTSTSFALSQKTSGIGASKATAVATSAGGQPTASVTVTMKAAATVSTAGASVGFFWGPVGPQTPAVGCLWMNSGAQTLFMWNGQSWIKKV